MMPINDFPSSSSSGDPTHHSTESSSNYSSPNTSSPINAQIVVDPGQTTTAQNTSSNDSHRKLDGASTKVEPFGTDGFKITLQTADLRVEMLTYGATINSVKVRDPRVVDTDSSSNTCKDDDNVDAVHDNSDDSRSPRWLETCLGFQTAAECERAGAPRGSTRGRFAGRIAHGRFTLDNTTYTLPTNDHGHTLHGGFCGFDKLQWKYLLTDGPEEVGVSFHLTSPHLDEGFPGDLYVTATYAIARDCAQPTLKYTFRASLAENSRADATVVNLTNHTYWNLNGVPAPQPVEAATAALGNADAKQHPRYLSTRLPDPITNHLLRLNAHYFAATSPDLIPSGEMVLTDGTVHDYTTPRCVAEGMRATAAALNRDPWGYDDPAALDTWDNTLREAAELYSPKTRLQMRVCTTNPAVVVYTGNFLPQEKLAMGRFQQHSGICLECQYFPDSPNIASFPTTVLRKGETYSETTTHEFMFRAAS